MKQYKHGKHRSTLQRRYREEEEEDLLQPEENLWGN